jgi:glycosyltransferase involved in cell wall biosynthesis
MISNIYLVHHHPEGFAGRSGFPGLLEQLRAYELSFDMSWKKLMRKSWRAGSALRQWGNGHYGSSWNGLIPYVDEYRMARQIREREGAVIHFIWGEFASPRHPEWFRKRGNKLVGTFHCSIRRLPSVLGNFRCWDAYDAWSVTSKSQIPFFLEHGVPESHIQVVPLGVDTNYFCPLAGWHGPESGPLQAILVGKTERDHEFAIDVMRAAPRDLIHLKVCTARSYHDLYRGVPGVEVLPYLNDQELLRLYQSAELMFMPFLDCTTNDALMESMACGTPVLTNRTGGIPEYVDDSCNFLMNNKSRSDWIDQLIEVKARREDLWTMRSRVRAWAERFDWSLAANQYRSFYKRTYNDPCLDF